MADLAALHIALNCIGFSNEAVTFIVDSQGMDTLAEFALLKDDEVKSLCKVVCRPGGTVPNPQAGIAGQLATIPNPGIAVPLHAENNLKLMWFYRNKYTQVFATHFRWVCVFPMKQKSDAHKGLSLLAQRDGVPPTLPRWLKSNAEATARFRINVSQACTINPNVPAQDV